MLFVVALIAGVAAVSSAQKTWSDVHECSNAAFQRCKDKCKEKISEDTLIDFDVCHLRKHRIFEQIFSDCLEALNLTGVNETSQCYRRKHEKKSKSESNSKSKEAAATTALPGFQTGAPEVQQSAGSSAINNQQSVTPEAVTQSQQAAGTTGQIRSKRHGGAAGGKGKKEKSSSSEEKGEGKGKGGDKKRHHEKMRGSSSSEEKRHHEMKRLNKDRRHFLKCKMHCAKPQIKKCFEGCKEGGKQGGKGQNDDEVHHKTHKCWRLAEHLSKKALFKCLRDTDID